MILHATKLNINRKIDDTWPRLSAKVETKQAIMPEPALGQMKH